MAQIHFEPKSGLNHKCDLTEFRTQKQFYLLALAKIQKFSLFAIRTNPVTRLHSQALTE